MSEPHGERAVTLSRMSDLKADLSAPPHAVRCLKAEGRRSVWLVQRPGMAATTVKCWPVTPALLLKLALGISQPQRQIRGTRTLQDAGIPSPAIVGPWRFARRGGRRVVELEIIHAPGVSALTFLENPPPDLTDERMRRIGAAVGATLASMTLKGVFNDDMKPDNLIVDESTDPMTVWVIDTLAVRRTLLDAEPLAEMLSKMARVPDVLGLTVPRSAWLSILHAALRPLEHATARHVLALLRARRDSR